MKLVYNSQDILLIGHLRNLLETQGIRAEIRNTLLGGAAGELPPHECWPELWVTDPANAIRAGEIIEAALARPETTQPPWVCSTCGEPVEQQFTHCWNCGVAKE